MINDHAKKLSVLNMTYSGKKIGEIRKMLKEFIVANKIIIDIVYWRRIYYMENHSNIASIEENIKHIEDNQDTIKKYFTSINTTLENSVYGLSLIHI